MKQTQQQGKPSSPPEGPQKAPTFSNSGLITPKIVTEIPNLLKPICSYFWKGTRYQERTSVIAGG